LTNNPSCQRDTSHLVSVADVVAHFRAV